MAMRPLNAGHTLITQHGDVCWLRGLISENPELHSPHIEVVHMHGIHECIEEYKWDLPHWLFVQIPGCPLPFAH